MLMPKQNQTQGGHYRLDLGMLRFIGMSESLACGCPSWNGRPRTRSMLVSGTLISVGLLSPMKA